MDTRSYLETGESVESYVRRMLPTNEDRVRAYFETAQLQDEQDRQYVASAPQYDENDQREYKQLKLRAMVAVGTLVGGAVFFLLWWSDLSKQGSGEQLSSGSAIQWATAAALAASAGVHWFIGGRELNFRRSLEYERSQRVKEQRARPQYRNGDIALLRTGWVPGTIGGLGRLGLSPNASSTDEGTSAPPRVHEAEVASPRMSYQAYLQTPHWKRVRTGALQRAGYRCQLDASHTRNLQVHHNNYHCLWNEEPEDVVVLCGDCHSNFHAGGRMPGR
jgi:5-methylcytosine-specific restriction endonuclease McrA